MVYLSSNMLSFVLVATRSSTWLATKTKFKWKKAAAVGTLTPSTSLVLRTDNSSINIVRTPKQIIKKILILLFTTTLLDSDSVIIWCFGTYSRNK